MTAPDGAFATANPSASVKKAIRATLRGGIASRDRGRSLEALAKREQNDEAEAFKDLRQRRTRQPLYLQIRSYL